MYAEVDPRTQKMFLRKPERRQEEVVDRRPPRVDTPRKAVYVAAPQRSDGNRGVGIFGFLSSIFAR